MLIEVTIDFFKLYVLFDHRTFEAAQWLGPKLALAGLLISCFGTSILNKAYIPGTD